MGEEITTYQELIVIVGDSYYTFYHFLTCSSECFSHWVSMVAITFHELGFTLALERGGCVAQPFNTS